MTTTAATLPIVDWKKTPVPLLVAGLAFLVAFGEPMVTLGRDWWSNPEAGHGLLLFPVALWLAWKKGLVEQPEPSPRLGMFLIAGSVLLRFLSGLAAEMFTMRLSLIGASAGLIVYGLGWRQVLRWWLPFLLILLSVPLPEVIIGSLALPLQFRASRWGAALLTMRHVPVRLAGNVIYLPGRSLFVTEACSGLRSLTALLALGILIGGLWLRTATSRITLIVAAIPVAMALNAVRIFLTGFFVFFVDPKLAEGVMHLMEGWVMFVLAFIILAAMAVLLTRVEAIVLRKEAGVKTLTAWPPAIALAIGALLATVGVQAQRTLPLRAPLASSVPASLDGYLSRDVAMSAEERDAVGVSDYLARVYSPPDTTGTQARYFTLYVGYYQRQVRGKTIHSPKNCLPGSGWEPLTSAVASLQTPIGTVQVNRYLIQKSQDQALVLYWYQGRGRVVANEYRVKWNLLQDAALRRRSDEALVRIVVPIRRGTTESAAFAQAARIARQLVGAVGTALPQG